MDRTTVEHIARLARVGLKEKERLSLAKELESVLLYVGQLQEVDIHDVPATAHAAALTNVTREDAVQACDEGTQELLRAQFPERKDNALVVPAIFERP